MTLTQRSKRLVAALRRLQSPAQDPFTAGLVAAAVGLVVGYAALGFRQGIAFVQLHGFGTAADDMIVHARALSWYVVLLTPVAGGFVVAAMLRLFLHGKAPHSVAEVIQANMVSAGRIRLRDGAASAVVAMTALGSGASVGREGPIVHLGATLAAFLAQRLKAPPAMARTLLGCGVAAAIAASFNAPLAGVFFALEVVLGSYAISAFAPIVIAGVMGTIVTRIHVGDYPAFSIPDYALVSFWEVPAFLLLGGVSALVAVAFMKAIFFADTQLARLPLPRWTNPPLAGLAVGVLALGLPELLGVGYGATDAALKQAYPLFLLLALLAGKLVASALCLAARYGSGVFSPSLFLGAMTGGAFGMAAAMLFPTLAASHGLYAIVGMGAVAGAVLGAPISTVLIVFELTGDYQVTLALMAATATASVISARFFETSFFHLQLKRRGLAVDGGRARLALRQRRVDSAMDEEFLIVPEDATLARVRALLARLTRGALIVVRQGGTFIGVIRPRDMSEDVTDASLDSLVRAADIARPVKSLVLASDSLDAALSLMTASGEDMLPVLDSLESRRVKGVVHKADVVMAFNALLLEAEREIQGHV
ncbi:MAG: chloride channel protein [Pseudomonadota bacterium]